MPASELGSHIEAAFDRHARFSTDSSGHTDKLLRYRTATGVPFAFDRVTKTASCFWFECDEAFKRSIEALGFTCILKRYEGDRKPGRRSNLGAIPEFKGQPLYFTYARSADDALNLALAL